MSDELLGRAEPLAILRDALSHAERGRGGLALVVGEPGIGKTSLAAAIAAEAEARGAHVTSGRAWELAESPPYFPLWECFRALGIDRTRESDSFWLWEEVLVALAEQAARAAVVWVLDDLHAADLQTLDLLTFLARPIRSMNVLVLVTAREHDPRISTRGAERLTRMKRDGVEIRLGPLPKTAVSELVQRVSGRSLTALAELLYTRTEGNPLFVVECARMLRDAAPGTLAGLSALPPTVRQLVLERVAPLPESTRAVLDAGAVLGREFSSGRVAKLLALLPAQTIEALRPALNAGMVTERRPGHFSFTHILVRDAIEEALTTTRAVELHARAAALLALEGESAEVLVERARHALASMDDEASVLAMRAAALLEKAGAFDRALAMLERIDEARAKGHLPAQTSEEELHRATLLQAAGRYAEAEGLCDALATRARSTDDALLLARAALVRGAELRPATVDVELVAVLRASLAMPPSDPRVVCLVEARLAAAQQPAADPRGPVALARKALATARQLDDAKLLVDVQSWAGAALVDYAPLDERIALNQELFDAALRDGRAALALRAQIRLGLDRIASGELGVWTSIAERVRDLSAELGHPRHRWRALLFGSMWSLARGDVVGSERALVEVKELSGLADDPALTLSLNVHTQQLARLLHRDDDMRREIAAVEARGIVPNVEQNPEISLLIRCACLAQLEDLGSLERLLALAEAASLRVEPTADTLGTEPGFFMSVVAHAASMVGDEATCKRLRARLVGRESGHILGGHVPLTYEGPIARLAGLLDARLGDLASAEALLRRARAEAMTGGLTAWVAQIEYDLGRVLAEAGRASDAEALLASAEKSALEIGMPGLAMRAAARRESGLPARGPKSSAVVAATSVAFVMQREGDVWRVRHGERELRVKDSRGMQILGRLVERAGEEIHVLALGSDEAGKSLVDAPTGPTLDSQARAEYKERLADLARELEDAESRGDRGSIEKLQQEKHALESEVLGALGLGGKARAGGSASERARVNIQRRLRDAVARIGDLDAAAGAYLEKAVRTGTYCRFGI